MVKKTVQTDMKRIKEIACMLLYMDISPTTIESITSHPFTNSWYVKIPGKQRGGLEMLDLHDCKAQDKWRMCLSEQINQSSLTNILKAMNKQYILCFLKIANPHISDIDLAETLRYFWSDIEHINDDVNVKTREIVSMFKRADINTLMNGTEREVFHNFGAEVTLYRGVTSYNEKNKKALSWTIDYNKAVWFANRFQTGDGKVWEITIPNNRILCYFNTRNEKEVIIDPYNLNVEIKIQEIWDEIP